MQMQMQEQLSKESIQNCITLKGSTEIIVEFFQYSINNILFQRGVYPYEKFTATKHYNLQMMITTDKELQTYLNHVLSQLQHWLLNGSVERLVLVIASQEDQTVLERWQFNIEKCENNNQNENENSNEMDGNDSDIEMKNSNENTNNSNNNNNNNIPSARISAMAANNNNNNNNKNGKKRKGKAIKEITREIQAIIRQITSSVTFLPLLEVPCSFDLLVYTDKDCKVPKKWELSEPKFIKNSENVKLRSFDTSIHKVDSLVSYKVEDDEYSDDEL